MIDWVPRPSTIFKKRTHKLLVPLSDQGISHPLVHGGPPWDPQNHFAIVICD